MNREEFLEFVSKNFNIGGDAMRLIDNILQYAERIVDLDERREFLNDTLLGSGEINHSGSGENRQFWSNENHQSGVASPQVVLFTRPAAGQPVSQ